MKHINNNEYIKNCGDCGRIVKKKDWVHKADEKKKVPLCQPCISNYNGQEF